MFLAANKSCFKIFLITLLCFSAGQDNLKAQEAEEEKLAKKVDSIMETEELWREDFEAEKYPDPNKTAATSNRSMAHHFFALPSTAWKIAMTPLRVTLVWADHQHVFDRVQGVFMNDAGTAGIFPIVGFGLNVPSSFGALLFHNNLFGGGEKYNGTFKYNALDNITARSLFTKPHAFGTETLFYQIQGDFFLDDEQDFFMGGNGGNPDSTLNYNPREGGGRFTIGYGGLGRKQEIRLTTTIRHYDTKADKTQNASDFVNAGLTGLGLNTMFSVGGTVAFDFTNKGMRTNTGTYLKFFYDYHNDLNNNLYEYQRLQLMAEHYIPVPFMAKNRRFYIRGLAEKRDRLNGKEIPFYDLSKLGSPFNLRGFDNERFRGRGRLLFNIEYRYPIWDNFDGFFFLDKGQVFNGFEDIGLDRFHTGYGTGIRFASPTGIGMNLGLGWSKETFRFYLQVLPTKDREEI